MMTIKDLAKALVEKHDLRQKDAEEFMDLLIEILYEGLRTDRLVKIKGLGTFKVMEVKERESISVNTGERVVIDGHDRITFTPDVTMRDLVNKPFVQFEAVQVNEGVDFSEIDGQEATAQVEQTEETVSLQSEETIPAETEPIAVPAIEQAGGPAVTEESVVEELPVSEMSESDEEEEYMDDEENESGRRRWILFTLAALLIAVGAFFAGYYMAGDGFMAHDVLPSRKISVKKKTVSKVPSLQPASTKNDSTVKLSADEEEARFATQYDKLDARVRTGAYRIVGIEQEVTVQKGQTLSGLSKYYLGSDMECYVEALNGRRELKAGDRVKIPKLKLRHLR